MARVVIFGCGVGADTAFRYLSTDTSHEIAAFAVDARYRTTDVFHGRPVVDYESVDAVYPPDTFHMFVLLGFQGMNRARTERYLDAKAKGYRFVTYVSSRNALVEPPAVGENCFILDGQALNLDVRIGNNVVLWSANHVGDRTAIADHAWVSSHVSMAGDVTVGEGCFLGVNASISNYVRLGARTFVGAGAVISKDTPEDSVRLAPDAREIDLRSDKFLAMLRVT